jgi:hypothetical protein
MEESMTDIKREAENLQDKAQEKKGEIKGRLEQLKQDTQEHSANEE